MPKALRFALFLLASATANTAALPAEKEHAVPNPVAHAAQKALAQPNIAGIGIARIEDGKLVWSGYWGEQSEGVPVTANTAFNTASVAKTIIAETVLRLADQGQLSLDDPIAEFYEQPDLKDDPRYDRLTPRILLSHQATLLNWRWNYDDNRLAFRGEPGNGEVSYSGAGVEIVMRYLEARFGKTYPELVQQVVLEPLGIEELAVAREAWLEGRVSEPRGGDGAVYPPFNRSGADDLIEPGSYSAADNLYATVPGYAQLLIALIEGTGLSPQMRQERATLLSSSDSALGYSCVAQDDTCPNPLGHGVGWMLFGEPGRTVINHGGNDFAEHAQVYFIPETREGLVMFVNGGNAFPAGIEILLAVDPELRMAKHFSALIKKMREEGGQ
ncbi:MAG: serine hydrolase domain-containing protein [Pseudomonadota bacterium]